MATHSSVLAWRIPGTGEPGGLRHLWGRTESDTTEATQQQQQQKEGRKIVRHEEDSYFTGEGVVFLDMSKVTIQVSQSIMRPVQSKGLLQAF